MTNKEMANIKICFSTASAHRPPARPVSHLFLLLLSCIHHLLGRPHKPARRLKAEKARTVGYNWH